jgi:MinD-like ATPase involved in chromosome partitioning or flagellar assembly
VTTLVLTAVTTPEWEARLVAGLERPGSGLRVARRCVDLADLLAAAAAGHGRAAIVSAELRGLDRDALGQLLTSGVAPVGIVGPGDEDGERRLRQLGVDRVVVATADATDVAAAVTEAIAGLDGAGAVHNTKVTALQGATAGNGDPNDPAQPGRLIAVWGPTGAPGRTTVAANLAYEIALRGRATLLADVDPYGAALAQHLGLIDEPPGITAAARTANTGTLDLPQLARTARQVAPRLRVLTGLNRSERWPELRPTSLEAIWNLARGLARVTVADCGFCLEQSDEFGYDTVTPQRNAATLTTMDHADLIVAVGSADPVGLQRLVRGLAELGEQGRSAPVRVVANRARESFGGRDAATHVADVLRRDAGIGNVTVVPDDRPGCDRALMSGQFLAEAAPASPARIAIRTLAASLIGEQVPDHRRTRRWRKTSRVHA